MDPNNPVSCQQRTRGQKRYLRRTVDENLWVSYIWMCAAAKINCPLAFQVFPRRREPRTGEPLLRSLYLRTSFCLHIPRGSYPEAVVSFNPRIRRVDPRPTSAVVLHFLSSSPSTAAAGGDFTRAGITRKTRGVDNNGHRCLAMAARLLLLLLLLAYL